MEHHRLSGLSCAVWDHCSQVLSAFVERPGVGVLRFAVRYSQIRHLLVTFQDRNHAHILLHLHTVRVVIQ